MDNQIAEEIADELGDIASLNPDIQEEIQRLSRRGYISLRHVEITHEWLDEQRESRLPGRVVGDSRTGKTMACQAYRSRNKPTNIAGKPPIIPVIPITAAVIDVMSQKAITYRSTKQLLGDNYRLLNRQRNLQTQQRHQSHKNQKQGRIHQGTNSDLGEYLDRLLAKAIVDLAQTYGAGSVALPKIEQIRLSTICLGTPTG